MQAGQAPVWFDSYVFRIYAEYNVRGDTTLDADFFIGLVKIILINVVLSGDNAVVIALACRKLPSEQQKKCCTRF